MVRRLKQGFIILLFTLAILAVAQAMGTSVPSAIHQMGITIINGIWEVFTGHPFNVGSVHL